ncbi:hypothetical protein HYALB_00005713 [Hymenoscyphus albidus]|uniref:Uncharacterized protein n=1 Tax=Hymenoscyphus albidus TaxID=595503 RepID=A0A9N9Q6D3_9HELO|nr:hypothetical protein HYALB_00005713 [Hymenoscyphus albidus]
MLIHNTADTYLTRPSPRKNQIPIRIIPHGTPNTSALIELLDAYIRVFETEVVARIRALEGGGDGVANVICGSHVCDYVAKFLKEGGGVEDDAGDEGEGGVDVVWWQGSRLRLRD